MNCACHGEPMRVEQHGRKCVVKAREAQAKYARKKRATSAEYRVIQRRQRLRRQRNATLGQLSQLQEEARQLGA